MAAVEYGTVAVVPKGEWSATTQYDMGNLVSYDGSSYVAKTLPPLGTLPTDLNYWQVSAQGGNIATTVAAGVVKPDGTTITVDEDGTIHGASTVDIATVEKTGIVRASNDIPVAEDGTMSVSTQFIQAKELANIIAGEAISQVLGKVSKSIAVTMGLDQNALLKNMLANNDVNDSNKIPTSAYIHTLYERIGMGSELQVGSNLTEAVNSLNSDIGAIDVKTEWSQKTVALPYRPTTDGVLSLIFQANSGIGYCYISDGAGIVLAIADSTGGINTAMCPAIKGKTYSIQAESNAKSRTIRFTEFI